MATHVPAPFSPFPVSDREFAAFQKLIYEEAGIHLSPVKKALLTGRLSKRVRELGLPSLAAYHEYVTASDPDERVHLLDCITTNETRFFREPGQFAFLEQELVPSEPVPGGARGEIEREEERRRADERGRRQLLGAADVEGAVQIEDRARDHRGEDHGRGRRADEALERRQVEDEEPDVAAEDGIDLAEGAAVPPEEIRLPARRLRDAGERGHDPGRRDHERAPRQAAAMRIVPA